MVKRRTRLRHVGIRLCVAVGALAGVAGCGGGSDERAANNTEPVKIGAIYPLTGPLASYGQGAKKALMCAQDLINGAHDEIDVPLASGEGLPALGGRKVEMVFADAPRPQDGVTAAQRLINDDDAIALTGSYSSAITDPASTVAERAKVPFVNGDSTASTLTARGYEYFFRVSPSDTTITNGTIEFAVDMGEKSGRPTKTVAIVYEDTDFGMSVKDGIKAAAAEKGLEVVAEIAYPQQSPSMTSVVISARKAKPDVIAFGSYVRDAVMLTQEMKQLGYAPNALVFAAGADVEDYVEALGADADHVFSETELPADLSETATALQQVDELCEEVTGSPLSDFSARSFTGLMVLAGAIDAAGSTDPSAVQKKLVATDLGPDDIVMPWDGVKFDSETHQNSLAEIYFQQIRDGKYLTVWPFDKATTEPVWPFPDWNAPERGQGGSGT